MVAPAVVVFVANYGLTVHRVILNALNKRSNRLDLYLGLRCAQQGNNNWLLIITDQICKENIMMCGHLFLQLKSPLP